MKRNWIIVVVILVVLTAGVLIWQQGRQIVIPPGQPTPTITLSPTSIPV